MTRADQNWIRTIGDDQASISQRLRRLFFFFFFLLSGFNTWVTTKLQPKSEACRRAPGLTSYLMLGARWGGEAQKKRRQSAKLSLPHTKTDADEKKQKVTLVATLR